MKNSRIGFFIVILLSQAAHATTFKIVDCISSILPSSSQRPKVGVKYYQRNIGRIAPIYYGKKTVYYEPFEIVFKRKLPGFSASWEQSMAYGIEGTTPGGLTLLNGIRFYRHENNYTKVYEARFDPGQEPSRLAVNVLITIHREGQGNASRYYCNVYRNSLLSGTPERMYFKQVPELYPE